MPMLDPDTLPEPFRTNVRGYIQAMDAFMVSYRGNELGRVWMLDIPMTARLIILRPLTAGTIVALAAAFPRAFRGYATMTQDVWDYEDANRLPRGAVERDRPAHWAPLFAFVQMKYQERYLLVRMDRDTDLDDEEAARAKAKRLRAERRAAVRNADRQGREV